MRPVDKGVPLPGPKSGLVADIRRLAEVGDSIFFEYRGRAAPDRFANNLVALGRKEFGRGAVTSRQVVENGVAGIRVWRVK